jgi:hypothetical protein
MEIKITLDTTQLKRAIRRLGKGRLFAGIVVAVLLGASTVTYAIGTSPTHVFASGDVISSSEVNKNFSELYEAVSAAEVSVTALQTDVDALETKASPHSCQWVYKFIAGETGTVMCPANKHPIAGGCTALDQGKTLESSAPFGVTSGDVTMGTGWKCSQSVSGGMDGRALCCAF